MTPRDAPQPIPYQGSKRLQVPVILRCLPPDTQTLWEPFVGSGAVTIGAAIAGVGRWYEVGDSLVPLVGIWELLLRAPDHLADRYDALWTQQLSDPRRHYDMVRDAYNANPDAVQLLYLIARCVKNAVRFNRHGHFNQSPDLRRLGMKPEVLRARARRVHQLLAGRASARAGDYSYALERATKRDVVYMDPPYLGVSGARDTRYYQGLDYPRFLGQLAIARDRGLSFLVSFDGRCGDRTYGQELPEDLGLTRLDVHVGRSSQATLSGRIEETVEALYLSRALVHRLESRLEGDMRQVAVKPIPLPTGQLSIFGP